MATTLYRNGTIYSAADPFATALLIDSDTVAWLGGEEAAERYVEKADEVIDLAGALITPAFVESHTHLAALGRNLGERTWGQPPLAVNCLNCSRPEPKVPSR